MSVLSECAELEVTADTDHQVSQEIPASVAENALELVSHPERVMALGSLDDMPQASEAVHSDPAIEPPVIIGLEPQPEPKSLEPIPFVSEDTSPFEHDEVILLDVWVVSRFYDTEAEARVGLNRLFAQTGINFAYGLKVLRHPFYLSDYRYYRYSFSARVGLYALQDAPTGDDDLIQLDSVKEDLAHQISVHHASRTLELIPRRTLEVRHYTVLTLVAGAALCIALHGIMNGWLLG